MQVKSSHDANAWNLLHTQNKIQGPQYWQGGNGDDDGDKEEDYHEWCDDHNNAVDDCGKPLLFPPNSYSRFGKI